MNENEIRKQFDEIYKTRIESKITRLEQKRQDTKKKSDLCSLYICGFFILVLISLFLSIQNLIQPIIGGALFLVSILCIIGISLYRKKLSKDFRNTIKQILLQPILSLFGRFEILQKEELSLKEIKALGLYQNASGKRDDDIIKGCYKKIPITIMETRLYHTEITNGVISFGSGRNQRSSRKITDFKGLIIKIRFNKNFKGITIGNQKENIEDFVNLVKEVAKKYPELCSPEELTFLDSPIFHTIGQTQTFMNEHGISFKNGHLNLDILKMAMGTKNKVTKNLEQIVLEDSKFNEKYNIFSDDQVESRYLLTPSFMERLKNIQSAFLVVSANFVFKNKYK